MNSDRAINYSVLYISVVLAGNLGLVGHLRAQDASSDPTCTTPSSGLVSWWQTEGNVHDIVSGNDGIPQGTVGYATGEVGQAVVLNGTTSIRVPASRSLDVGQGNGLTFEAWLSPSNSSFQTVCEWNLNNGSIIGTAQIGVNLEINVGVPGDLVGNIVDTTVVSHKILSTTNIISDNAFQHVAMTYDKASGIAVLYRNGVVVATTNLGSFTPQTSFDFFLGVRPSGYATGYYFQGELDEPTLYNRALSASEIQAIYNAGNAGKCSTLEIIAQPTDQSVFQGRTAAVSVKVLGAPPLGYQWFFNSNILAGQTTPILVLTNVQLAQQGYYSVTVSNASGKITSSNAFLTVLSHPVCVPAPSGLVAWWRAESNTLDSIGINNAVPSPQLYTNGEVGTAFNFSSFSPLGFPASDQLDIGAGEGFTIEGWIHPNSSADAQPLIDWSNRAGNSVGLGLFLNLSNPGGNWSGNIGAIFTDTNGTPHSFVLESGPNVITNFVWQHVALTFNRASGLATIYVNGVPVAGGNPGASFSPMTRTTVFMAYVPELLPPFRAGNFVGAIDEFSVYNRALSTAEIQAIVLADTAGKCPPPPPSCVPAPAGIVAWWRGQSNALDSVDGNNGIISNTVAYGITNYVTYTNGEVGTGFHFNSSFIKVPAASNLDLGVGPGLTVELWVKPTYSQAEPFVEWNSGTGTQGVYLAYSAVGSLILEAGLLDIHGTNHVLRFPLNLNLVPSVWEHLALTYDKGSGVAALYFNGIQVASNNFGSFTPRTTGNFYLGYRPPGDYLGSGYYFVGAMDEVSLYNRALAPSEIRAVIAATSAGKCAEAPFIVTQPMSQRVTENFSATFDVVAGGTPNLHYQWRFGPQNAPIPGATSASFTLDSVQATNAGLYSVQITNAFGSVLSSNVLLVINLPPVPIITVSPLAQFPGDSNLTIIAACGANTLVAFDGSKSYDPGGSDFSYYWFEGTNLFSTNVVATNLLGLGTHEITLLLDDHIPGGTNSAMVTVQVISPTEAIGLVIDFLNGLGLSHTQSLVASLKAAANSFTSGNTTSGANQLGAFQNKVQAQVAPNNPAVAASLIQATQQILDALGRCGSGDIAGSKIVSLARRDGGKIRLKLAGNPVPVQLVEASTNLVDWKIIGTATENPDGALEFEDGNTARFSNRFYRVVPLRNP
jgi:hypothetical protein